MKQFEKDVKSTLKKLHKNINFLSLSEKRTDAIAQYARCETLMYELLIFILANMEVGDKE